MVVPFSCSSMSWLGCVPRSAYPSVRQSRPRRRERSGSRLGLGRGLGARSGLGAELSLRRVLLLVLILLFVVFLLLILLVVFFFRPMPITPTVSVSTKKTAGPLDRRC